MNKSRLLLYITLIGGAFIVPLGTPSTAEAYIEPFGCVSGFNPGDPTVHCQGAVTYICFTFCGWTHGGRYTPAKWSGTKVVHCHCDDGWREDAWYNAPCGYCVL